MFIQAHWRLAVCWGRVWVSLLVKHPLSYLTNPSPALKRGLVPRKKNYRCSYYVVTLLMWKTASLWGSVCSQKITALWQMHDWEVTGRWSLLKWNWSSLNSCSQQLEWSKWMSSCCYCWSQVFQAGGGFILNQKLLFSPRAGPWLPRWVEKQC